MIDAVAVSFNNFEQARWSRKYDGSYYTPAGPGGYLYYLDFDSWGFILANKTDLPSANIIGIYQ